MLTTWLLSASLAISSVSHRGALNLAPQSLSMPHAITATSPHAGRTVTATIQRSEGMRTYHVYIPANLSTTRPPGLVVYFHGWQDTCDSLGGSCGSDLCGWPDEAEKKGTFLFVYPCGLGGLVSKGSWNAGTCCGPSGGHSDGYKGGPDDLGFVNAMIGDIASSTGETIDMTRLYAAGFSNGGMLAQVIGCGQFPGAPQTPFRAMASCAGIVEIEPGEGKGLDACDAAYGQRPANATGIAVLDIHGDKDPVVPFGGDLVLGFPKVQDNIDRWTKRLGCTGTPVQTLNAGSGKYTNQLWKRGTCATTSEVELVTVKGLGHGCTNDGDTFSSNVYMSDFFARHGL